MSTPCAQERERDTEVIKDKGKAKRRKLERALKGTVKEKNQLPKDAFRIEHLNYKVRNRFAPCFPVVS